MKTLKNLFEDGKIQKLVTDIVKTELGNDSEVVVQCRVKDTRLEFFVITTIGNLTFNLSLDNDLEYLEFFLITELQDEQNKQDLKLAYETMCDSEFSKIANRIKRCKTEKGKLKILKELDTTLLDVFANSKYGKALSPKN